MLSRASITAGQQSRIMTALLSRAIQTGPPAANAAATSAVTESGERDLVNFPRPVRLINPGKVRLGIFPEEWFQFFYKKTGVTGPYMFGLGLVNYLVSKEIYVLEHEYYTGLSMLLLCVVAVKKIGPAVSAYATKQIDDYERSWSEDRESEKQSLETAVKNEQRSQWQADGQTMLMEAKRENVSLQLEAAYRERILKVYHDVKHRLDYQFEKQAVEARIAQKNLISWVTKQVLGSITPDQDKQTLNKCIADLGALAKTVK